MSRAIPEPNGHGRRHFVTSNRARSLIAVAAVTLIVSHARAVPGPLEPYHGSLTRALQLHIRETVDYRGRSTYRRVSVNYDRLRSYAPWQKYFEGLARADSARIRSAPLNDRKAFWINTYNAMVIDIVLAHYPIRGEKSFRSIRGALDEERSIAGSFVTLRKIEAKLAEMNDPRMVFAVSKAARSSPALSERALNPTQIEDQLEWAANSFLADPANYRLDQSTNEVHLSAIFEDEYAAFPLAREAIPSQLLGYTPAERAILAFILPRIAAAERQYILNKHPRVVYETFDWSLNDTTPSTSGAYPRQ